MADHTNIQSTKEKQTWKDFFAHRIITLVFAIVLLVLGLAFAIYCFTFPIPLNDVLIADRYSPTKKAMIIFEQPAWACASILLGGSAILFVLFQAVM
ncbi:hypothetical protein BLNAU_22914 [Blattamonas nauphoetae]|uniref:Uncharacterized protein n=1 Tax=Blattamonas nauphoetae TaxID=2049346 RepID=A0ABQ9WRP0_9EUKA|nr:hypothetical protein BLNAU_22914 [Blattamonas nauphoetae]